MLPKLRQQIWRWRGVLIAAPSVAGLVIAASYAGLFQLVEWAAFDQFMRLRPLEAPDSRVIIVTIDDQDLQPLGQWPVPDKILAELIEKIKLSDPRFIGLHLYRPLPVQPGEEELTAVFQSTPNLIGVEKFVGDKIAAPPILQEQKQVAISDLVLDADGKLRRTLIAIEPDNGHTRFSLGAKLALLYLKQEGITPQETQEVSDWFVRLSLVQEKVKLGQAIFSRFQKNDGGYVDADSGGYQILLNFRGTEENFQTLSMTQVLENQVDPELLRDKIVLIGSIAQGFNTFYYTPYSSLITPPSSHLISSPRQTAGVVIQANLASQMISSALDNRPVLRVWSEPVEWLWILSWSLVGAVISWKSLQIRRSSPSTSSGRVVMGIIFAGGCLICASYGAFLLSWWIPVVTPLIALTCCGIIITGYHHQGLQRLASLDGLTQVANRHYFDQYLEQEWWQKRRAKEQLSLILCDVDYFKIYNDTYGHQAGDECLQKVAQAITCAVRPTDLVARYGGEEFVVILPHTDTRIALLVAERIRSQVKKLHLEHRNSQVNSYVTLSCGVASSVANRYSSPQELIYSADKALYLAKEGGRDCVILG